MATKIVQLPFNGSAVGTGSTPVTATLLGSQYIAGRVLNQAVSFPSEGRAEVSQNVVPFTATWTITVWLKALPQPGGSVTDSWVLFRFAGDNRFLYLDLASRLTRWSYLVIIQDAGKVSAYLDGELKASEAIPTGWGKPTGFCVLNDGPAYSGYMSQTYLYH